jgi:hypothetical protein
MHRPRSHAALLDELDRRKTPKDRRARVVASLEKLAQQESAITHHNVAAALGDAGCWRAAAPYIERVFQLGGDAPESWLVRARVRSELADFDGAEAAYVETLRRQPLHYEAHRELAQLRWMRSGDIGEGLAPLNEAISRQPQALPLRVLKAQVLEGAGFVAESHDLYMQLFNERPADPAVAVLASQGALAAGDVETAFRVARQGYAASLTSPIAAVAFATACLASGDLAAAAAPIAQLRAADPDNQHAIALQALLWRLSGDARYRELYDYGAFARTYHLAAPPGWSGLDDYVADLAEGLAAAHRTRAHPFNQSIKQGTQATSILDSEHPALRALPAALDPPLRQYLDHLGEGSDPLRSRKTGDYAIHGVWSIRMQAGGRHINHVHSQGWISSACYVCLPPVTQGREGWLTFGEPGVPTPSPCPPEHFIEPAPGRLALFPSYMWHGTVPFTGLGDRLTFAFDLVPG